MKDKGVWVRSDVEVNPGETLYFFHPVDGGGGQAWVALGKDGTVTFEGYQKKVTIRGVGSESEGVKTQNLIPISDK